MACLDDATLADLLGRRLGREEEGEAKRHLDACSDCFELWSQLAKSMFEPSVTPSAQMATIGARYRILSLLGSGGMGDVYLAHDSTLRRDVALKVVRSERAGQKTLLERLRREVHLASKVTHENVLRVFDLAEEGGASFFTMQYVVGHDLGALLRREGPLSAARTRHFARQICGGLAAAHAQGVIHRDLKPSNILIDERDHAYVADFGLAKALDDPTMTAVGTMIGSPAYMSPEQMNGGQVDARSDVYALGAILYEMITGVAASTGGSVTEGMPRRLARKATTARPKAPTDLVRVAIRCMAVRPSARYRTIDEVLAALDNPRSRSRLRGAFSPRRALVALLVVGLAAFGVRWFEHRTKRADAAGTSVLAMPTTSSRAVTMLIRGFENRTGDPMLDLTLDRVFARAVERAAFITPMAGQLVQPGTRGPAGTRVVLVTGDVTSTSNAYALSMQASDAPGGTVILARTIHVPDHDGFVTAIGTLASDLRTALGDTPPASREAASQTGMSLSLDANHEVALAFEFGISGQLEDALVHATRAIEIDPRFAYGHSLVALEDNNLGRRRQAEEHYRLALSFIDQLTELQKLRLRRDYYKVRGEYDQAIAVGEEILQKYPDDPTSEVTLSLLHALNGNAARALEFGRRGLLKVPSNLIARDNVVWFEIAVGDFPAALRDADAMLEGSDVPPSRVFFYRGAALLALGRSREARESYQRLEALGHHDSSMGASALADLALYEGRTADAAAILEAGIAADATARDTAGSAAKWATLGQVRLLQKNTKSALEAADHAARSDEDGARYGAALLYAEAGRGARARAISAAFAEDLAPQRRTLGKLVDAHLLLLRGKIPEAIETLLQAKKGFASWLVSFELGQIYLKTAAYGEAHAEFEACWSRRGEAATVFFDDTPTLHYLPLVQYFLGRAREGLGSVAASESYRAFLSMRGDAAGDLLSKDAKRRLVRQ